MSNNPDALDLYAHIEDMLQNYEASDKLYSAYFEILDELKFDSLLDVGCGSGAFLSMLSKLYPQSHLKGIDLSPAMVERTLERGIEAQAVDLCDLDGKFDVITAVFDMVNYLDADALSRFMYCVESHLNDGGYFIFDVNSEYGFDEIASGSFTAEDEDRFLVIDSYYEHKIYRSLFTLFLKQGQLYSREDQEITQYYYDKDTLLSSAKMRLLRVKDIALYSEDIDKHIYIFKKEKR